jgi:thiol-disulfide isomerase/thioredoxin
MCQRPETMNGRIDMKNSILQRALLLIVSVILAFAARTADARLTVGDPAPKLQVGEWVQGEPVREFDANHVYIVEFWATWCGPCRASIPHLNELAEKFKDKGVIAVGQDVWEEDHSAVAPFVKKMGDKMTYRVTLDKGQGRDGEMADTWMKAADQNGIPTAFVINKQGRIAWIGHPMRLNEKLLEEILTGKFDMAGFAKEYEQAQQEQKQQRELNIKLQTALREKNWDAADAAVAELEKTVSEHARYQFSAARLQILLGRKNYDGAYNLAESLSTAQANNVGLQYNLARFIATQSNLEKRFLVLAEKMAERANTATQGKEPAILDTLARVQFANGKTDEAIATEQKAVAAAKDESKSHYQKALTNYQQGKLPQ